MRRFTCLLVFVLLTTLALPAQQAAASGAGTVAVSASGSFSAPADTAVVNWLLSGRDASLKQAYAQAQDQAAQVRNLLRMQHFTTQQAHWSGYQVQPQIDYKTHRVTGYTVSVSLQLEITDFSKIGPLVDAAGAAGLTALRGISFELKDMAAAKAAAIADGYRQAHAEATALARAAGRRLLGLDHASVDVASPSGPQPMMRAMLAAEAAPPPTAGFTPQTITVTARVSAVYRLQP